MLVGGRLLLKREGELDRLRGLLARAAAGEGALAVVTGPAGIGKTRLARAVREEAQSAGFRVLAARGAELERDYGLGVVHQWLDPVRRLEAPLQPSDPAERDDASFSALHSLYWLVAGLAEEQPLALVLDDAQWSDEASLRFTGFLSRRLEGLPVLVLLTARTPAPGALAELAADPAADRLELRPLGPAAVAELLRARAPGEVDESFALACLEATGGNPFLLGELVQALLDEDVAFVGAERGRVPAVGPRSVATAVQLRLARLGPDAAGLARAAAVAGDDVPLPLATALAGLDEAAAATAADELAAAGVLEDGRPLRFVHPIVAAAIRESLLAGECEALHARAARLLADGGAPASAVALHLLPLEPRGDAEVAATLLEAGQRALAEGAPESAAALLERALAEPPPPGRLAGVLLALGEAEHALERPGAARRLREAIRVADDPRERGRAALLLTWAVVSGTAEPRDVTGLLDACIAELEPVDPDLALRLEPRGSASPGIGRSSTRSSSAAAATRASPGRARASASCSRTWRTRGWTTGVRPRRSCRSRSARRGSSSCATSGCTRSG